MNVKVLHIEILKPDINKSYTRFTVDDGKIRFGLGSIKNVGTSAVDEIVAEREIKMENIKILEISVKELLMRL